MHDIVGMPISQRFSDPFRWPFAIRAVTFIDEPHRGEAYSYGHVTRVDNGKMWLAYGDKNMPRTFWLGTYGMGTPIETRYISEIWRKHDVVKKSSFITSDGRSCNVRSLETEWVQVA